MNRYKTMLIIFPLFILAACSGNSDGKKQLHESLEYNHELWESRGVEKYSITYVRDCLCEPSFHSSLIEDGEVLKSWNELAHKFEDEGELHQYTSIEYLFELIHFAVHTPTRGIYVDFDPVYGYPREVEIYFSGPVEDYVSYSVVDFNAGEFVEVEFELAIAAQSWQAEFNDTYDFTLEVSCFCDLAGEVLDVSVVDGEVASASDSLGNDLPLEQLANIPSVAEMFTEIEEAIGGNAAGVLAEFDPLWGYPLNVSINETPGFADDEFSWTLTNMQIDFAAANQNKFAFYSELWEQEKPYGYHYLLWSPELDAALQYHVEVVDDAPNGAHVLDLYGDWQNFDVLTLDNILIEDYFLIVENALEQGADTIVVYYDERFGNPTDIYIDFDETLEGDEVEYNTHITHYWQ